MNQYIQLTYVNKINYSFVFYKTCLSPLLENFKQNYISIFHRENLPAEIQKYKLNQFLYEDICYLCDGVLHRNPQEGPAFHLTVTNTVNFQENIEEMFHYKGQLLTKK